MAHIGLTPQSVNAFGGFKVQGKDKEAAKELIRAAKAVEKAGAFAVVLECVPTKLAELISKEISIPQLVLEQVQGVMDKFLYIKICWGCIVILPLNL